MLNLHSISQYDVRKIILFPIELRLKIRIYNKFKKLKGNQFRQRRMQLQQSGYRLSRSILSPIPKPVFILAAFTVLALMITNAFLAISAKPTLRLSNCLERYYDLTHKNVSHFLSEVTQGKDDKISSTQDLNQIIKFLNQSRLLQFQTAKELPSTSECLILLNYRPHHSVDPVKEESESSDKKVLEAKTVGYMVSNYPLFSINRTDNALVQKHGIIIDRILLPKIQVGYRYFGTDLFVSQVEDFLFTVIRDFVQFQQNFRDRLFNQYEKLSREIIQTQKREQQQEKQARNETNSTDDEKKKDKEVIVQKKNKELNLQLNSQLKETDHRTLQEQLQNGTLLQQVNATSSTTLIKQYRILSNIISTLLFKTTSSKHKIVYTFDSPSENNGTQEWHNVILPSTPGEESHSVVWRFIGKCFTGILYLCYLLFGFYVIGMSVRYGFIVGGVVLGVSGRCGKKIGWVMRFLNIYHNRNNRDEGRRGQNLKIMAQIALSFISMYLLLAFIGYLLSLTFGMIISASEMIPNHTYYSNRVLATFFLIEIFHYVFFRTRVAIQFFYKFSLFSTMTIMMMTSYHPYFYTSFFVNFHLLFTIFIILCFLFVQKFVSEEELESGFKPSLEKPRMLFYLGYDLDWHRGIPPIWTMFQPWFDLSYANEQERSYIDQNYQLLYGRLMGVNEPQELPDEDDENQQSASFKQREMLESSDRN